MSEQRDFFKRLVDLLDKASVPYMVAGSLGSSLHGRPRATNDIDLVIAPTELQFQHFLDSLGLDYYISKEAAWAALSSRTTFNIIDIKTGWKADLRVRGARPFSITEFDRRRKAAILGMEVWVLSPEDVILSKLEWAKQSASQRQMQDVLGVLQMRHESLDKEYLRKWADVLGVQDLLKKLLKEAQKEME
jgi:hypothetical protein